VIFAHKPLNEMDKADRVRACYLHACLKWVMRDYYRTTILSDETDPNNLHDLKSELDGYQVYSQAQIDDLVGLYLNGADRSCSRSMVMTGCATPGDENGPDVYCRLPTVYCLRSKMASNPPAG